MIVMFAYGHGSQMMSASYIPWIILYLFKIYKTPKVLNYLLFSILIGFQLQRGHVQIAYYTWMMIGLFFVINIFYFFKNEVKDALRWLDVNININWPLMHYKSAVRYLQKDVEDIAATGGTNWQKYLPPRFQKRIFYPELWTEKELEEWGKGWVKREVFNIDE